MKAPLALAALLLTAASHAPAERIVSGDRVIAVSINGTPGRVRVDPAALGMPIINAEFANRAGLKAGPFGIGYGVGKPTVWGRSAVVRIDAGTGVAKHRIGWTERPFAAGVEGVIGPAALPDPVIRFQLRPAAPGETTAVLPMVDGGGLFGGFSGLFTTLLIDDEPIRVRFDPSHPRSLATAGAATRLSVALGGKLTGDTASQEIAFGIERPVRTMLLARPIAVGQLRLSSIGVRTNDFGSVGAIPDADEHADPDEVLVTAKGKRNRSHDRITLGRDQLDHCSSIVFDKPARQIRLTCG